LHLFSPALPWLESSPFEVAELWSEFKSVTAGSSMASPKNSSPDESARRLVEISSKLWEVAVCSLPEASDTMNEPKNVQLKSNLSAKY
jgi:hypothetical protein